MRQINEEQLDDFRKYMRLIGFEEYEKSLPQTVLEFIILQSLKRFAMRKINIISGDFTATSTHTIGKNVELTIENTGDGEGFTLVMNAQKAKLDKPKKKWRWF